MPPPDVEGPPDGAMSEGPKQSDEIRTATTVSGDHGRDPYADPRQTTIYDALDEGRRRRDDGQQVATYATDVAWTRAADQAIRDLAASGREFTAEDVRSRVGSPFGSHNAMGARFMAATRAGLIQRVGSRQATRPEAAGRWIAVWRGAA